MTETLVSRSTAALAEAEALCKTQDKEEIAKIIEGLTGLVNDAQSALTAANARIAELTREIQDFADRAYAAFCGDGDANEIDVLSYINNLARSVLKEARDGSAKCTCGYWRAARLSHAADCPALNDKESGGQP